jgi:hypothetical protein
MITTHPPIRELSASDLTKSALLQLKLRRILAWRQNNLTSHRRVGIVTKGVSDLLGVEHGTGRLVVCEVKKIGDVLSKDQKEWLASMRDAGAIVLICTQKGNQVALIDFEEYIKK